MLVCLVTRPTFAVDAPNHACDRLAADPMDNNKVGPGVEWKLLDPKLAVPACEAAVRDYPDVARFKFQYARVLTKAGEYEKAAKLFRELAEHHYAPAQTNLGGMYGKGMGVSRDEAEALRWTRAAAEQGYAPAQYNLGTMYWMGGGVPRDDTEAVRWYRKAAEQGYPYAQTRLGEAYRLGRGVPKDDTEAVRWYRKAAEQGDGVAQASLGGMYEEGRGVPRDDTEALRWYRKVARGLDPISLAQLFVVQDELFAPFDTLQQESSTHAGSEKVTQADAGGAANRFTRRKQLLIDEMSRRGSRNIAGTYDVQRDTKNECGLPPDALGPVTVIQDGNILELKGDDPLVGHGVIVDTVVVIKPGDRGRTTPRRLLGTVMNDNIEIALSDGSSSCKIGILAKRNR